MKDWTWGNLSFSVLCKYFELYWSVLREAPARGILKKNNSYRASSCCEWFVVCVFSSWFWILKEWLSCLSPVDCDSHWLREKGNCSGFYFSVESTQTHFIWFSCFSDYSAKDRSGFWGQVESVVLVACVRDRCNYSWASCVTVLRLAVSITCKHGKPGKLRSFNRTKSSRTNHSHAYWRQGQDEKTGNVTAWWKNMVPLYSVDLKNANTSIRPNGVTGRRHTLWPNGHYQDLGWRISPSQWCRVRLEFQTLSLSPASGKKLLNVFPNDFSNDQEFAPRRGEKLGLLRQGWSNVGDSNTASVSACFGSPESAAKTLSQGACSYCVVSSHDIFRDAMWARGVLP